MTVLKQDPDRNARKAGEWVSGLVAVVPPRIAKDIVFLRKCSRLQVACGEPTCNFQPATCNFLFGTSSLVAASVALCLCLALRQLISIFCFPNFCFYPRAFALNSDGIFPT
jgi:hypothetical protein